MTDKLIFKYFLKPQHSRLKTFFKTFFISFLKLFSVELLTREKTIKVLKFHLLDIKPENRIYLPTIEHPAYPGLIIFNQQEALTHQAYVWKYKIGSKKATQLRYGAVLADGKVFCSDFDQSSFFQSLFKWNKREVRNVTTLIAPWSQYLDGIVWGGYYDFVLLVAAKLCRIKDSLAGTEFSSSTISYPFFGTTYEFEYLKLLDIKSNQLVDSRYNKVKPQEVVLANNGHWYYPNLTDILSLKKFVENKLQIKKVSKNRIYISRSGRRRVQNEKELIAVLWKLNFIIIEDKPRSVEEQVRIYKNASFIVGPHGASFTNIIWCEPGTHLFELFSPNYIPDHFLYLSQIMNMKYSAYYYTGGNKKKPIRHRLTEDIYVAIPEIERCLSDLLNE